MEKKKIFWALGIIIVIVIIVFGINEWQLKTKQSVDASHACAINFMQTFVFNVATSTSPSMVARTLLTQLLEQYKSMSNCYTLGVKDYTIQSVGKAKFVGKDFTVPATFDVIPLSKDKTLWNIASTTEDGDWIRGEHPTLGIQNISTTTLESYRLVLQ